MNALLNTQKLSLVQYLAQLNSADSQQGIYVNPENTDDYIVRPIMFGYNRQEYGDYVLIGSLDRLSFGFQSQLEAIESFLKGFALGDGLAAIEYNNKKVVIDIKGIMESIDNLDEDFRAFLDQKAEEIEKGWSENEAELFVIDQLPEILQAAKED